MTAVTIPLDYYDLPEVSCSDLKNLDRAFNAKPDPWGGVRGAIEFGSLVDAILTEKHRLDYRWLSLQEHNKKTIFYTQVIWDKAHRMADKILADEAVARLVGMSVPQYVFRRTLRFEYDGLELEIRARCKFDLFAKAQGVGSDFKMLAIKTQKALLESIDWFDYDMQAAYYMDLAGIDYFWILCGSKPTEKVFKYAIERDSDAYKRGRDKYARWAYYWITLIQDFK